jgi:hypothetical protein
MEHPMDAFLGYVEAHEETMRVLFRSLPEDHRRRYAATEALKIGYGGVCYIARTLGISRRTIYTGIKELEAMRADDPQHPKRPSGGAKRIRRPGGGRPKKREQTPGLEATVEDILEAHSAGSPTDPRVRWTDLKPTRLAAELTARGFALCPNTAADLLAEAGFRRRSLAKELPCGPIEAAERDAQFNHIAAVRRAAHARGIPVFSVDTKKKEPLGTLHRPGQCYSSDVQYVYDHDYRYLAEGVLIPHGVYDDGDNTGFLTLGTSHETSAFICDAIALAWEEDRRERYPKAKEIVLLFDAGGANAARSKRLKEDLFHLSERLGLRLHVLHYPPYTSKWNPIEHRLFSQVERSFRGVMLDSAQTALAAVERTTTATGLRVTGRILEKVYALSQKCTQGFLQLFDKVIQPETTLGKWNYIVDAHGAA